MSEFGEYMRLFAQYPFALKRFLGQRLTPDEAQRIVRERRTRRAETLSEVIEKCVFDFPASPYLKLFRLAGCELGDARALIQREGAEGALTKLRAAGIYVTFEEFKGRKPMVRGSQTIPVTASDFDNPRARSTFSLRTGGTTGLASAVGQDFDYIAAGMAHHLLMLYVNGALDKPMAFWMNILPGNAIRFVLQRAYLKQPVTRWYSQLGWRATQRWLRYDLAMLYMIFWLRVRGADAPFPKIAKHDEGLQIARWMADARDAHGGALLYAGVSMAMRVCTAANEAGIDLSGTAARIGGEPITPGKLRPFAQAGMRAIPMYGMNETGTIGAACLHPAEGDEVHLLDDLFALITHPYPIAGGSVPAFNLTGLQDASPKVMLNYKTDDFGMIETRDCGCAWHAYGFHTHVREIRSYSKLVAESVTLIGNELVDILEHVLPARFGGTPLDYQLQEQEDEKGLTRVYLLISPRLEIADEQAVRDTFLRALGQSSPMGDAARAVWDTAQTIQIKRAEPAVTTRGKFFPLHLAGRATHPREETKREPH